MLFLVMGGLSPSILQANQSLQGVIQRGDFLPLPVVQKFIDRQVREHGFERQWVTDLFANAKRQERVLELIARPAERKPWHQYRPIFVTRERASAGVKFWRENEAALERAFDTFGVEPEIIVAIIGVETYYGRQTGGFKVFDTLATLGFLYPPRSSFFKSELEQYLLLSREEAIDPIATEGSYAGAMGRGQFISSSYREYAVDFDGDGKRDLWHSNADAIGSVASYFKRHGWRAGGRVALPVKVRGSRYRNIVEEGKKKPALSPAELRSNGVTLPLKLPKNTPVALYEFDASAGNEYWVGLNNFYVITRYNHSKLYAMAVYQLSRAIRKLKAQHAANG